MNANRQRARIWQRVVEFVPALGQSLATPTAVQMLPGWIVIVSALIGINMFGAVAVNAQTLPSVLDPGVTQVVAGDNHNCALTTAGGVLCWGYNSYGQLGTTTNSGTGTPTPTPTAVPGLPSGVAALAAGSNHTCALTTAGGVLCWGQNYFGQLGTATNNGIDTDNPTPTAVPDLTSGVAALAAGRDHTCALTTAGGVQCWGLNYFGQLGFATNSGATTPNPTPTAVPSLASGVAALVAGTSHTCALTTAGGVQCWGSNDVGQLGSATNSGAFNPNPTPTVVTGLASGVGALAAGSVHTCALTTTGGAYCWGLNRYGQLGTATNNGTGSPNPTPTAVTGLTSGVAALTAGLDHTCALTAGGGVQCWGRNRYGQLGTAANSGNNTPNPIPAAVSGLTSGVAALAAGSAHSCALTAAGGVQCWGYNFYGQLGSATNNGTFNPNPTPTAVTRLTHGVTTVAAGSRHTCALTPAGGVKCWGYNYYGQLGTAANNGNSTPNPTPTDVPGLTSGVTALAAGEGHTCALTSAGGVKCWGWNYLGQLGTATNNGTSAPNPVPTDVPGLTSGVAALAASGGYTCAVTTGGGVKCWGLNESGQLGTTTNNGAFSPNPTPTDVPGLSSGIAALAAGQDHICARTTAGGVKCWGLNIFGQLGTTTNNGTGLANPTPTDVPGLTSGVTALTAGTSHTCALTTGGGLKCWGWNYHGQLGTAINNGTGNPNPNPTDVPGLTSGMVAPTAGEGHSCARTATGGVKCWGWNHYGQLGTTTNNGVDTPVPTPTDVPGLVSGIAALVAGGTHTCAVTTTGGARCWGENRYGQLAKTINAGTINPNPTPASVRGGQTISMVPPAPFAVGAPVSLSATASSGLAVTFDTWTPGTCTVTAAGVVTPLAAALCGVRASQVGSAGSASGSIAPAPQKLMLVAVAVNGVCGTANGVPSVTTPSANLCSAGTASSVTAGSASFTWSCAGDNGGSTASCAAPRQYTVSASAGANGSLLCGGGASVAVTSGGSTTCTATPNAGFETLSISGCGGMATGVAVNNYSTAAVSADCTVTATFQMAVVGACGAAHTVPTLVAPSSGLCGNGTASSVSTAVATFSWTCSGSNPGSSTDDVSCSAPRQYSVTASTAPIAGGTVTCTPNPVTANGSSTCTFTPAAGYVFSSWSGDCTGSAGCTLSAIISNKAVTANLLRTQTITAPALSGPFNPGSSLTLTGSASSGLPLNYSAGPAYVCTVAGTVLSFVGPGLCQITITQPGDAAFAAAPAVTLAIAVNALSVPLLDGHLLVALTLLLAGASAVMHRRAQGLTPGC